MSHLAISSSLSVSLPLPRPKQAIEIAPATLEDVDFIDRLQKQHRDRVGWHPRGALEGKIKLGQIIIAKNASGGCIGYCMASDRYMKREDCGIIYQMNVAPGHQRAFVGAALLKAQFDRSAYGCRLYCCWCAQDIEANRFWEAMGFVPLAFRAGSEKRQRVHIFWQKRIRSGDMTTPWWFPSETKGGSMEDRLVFPILSGTHWSDAKPMILPGQAPRADEPRRIKGPVFARARKTPKPEITPTPKRPPLVGALHFSMPTQPQVCAQKSVEAQPKPRAKRTKAKNDPKLVSAARELRDRYLEHLTAHPDELLPQGKYEVARPRALSKTAEAALQSPLLLAA
ncbi:MAG: GNAT family N-acetyltransferase [Chthoniobacterales bacterium]|nr:GNAT family N-acetyltransferase [Chthoniobacterales bacterium]